MSKAPDVETLRSGFSLGGARIFLIYDCQRRAYRLATRWRWLASFATVFDACDAFEALELVDGEEVAVARLLVREIHRVPRHRFANPSGMPRIAYLVNAVERRLAGLRPIRTGSKGAVEAWVPA